MAGPSQIFLQATLGRTHVLRDLHTVADLNETASRLLNCSPDALVLSTGTRVLTATPELAQVSLAELGVEDNTTVWASARLLGGGKKRKKKTYTKPKKIKHKHKTVKMAALKYYKVGADGVVERLRKECPAAICGAGIFFAAHADRLYCGKCGLTYVEQQS